MATTGTARLAAFSDGIFAIAATLLVLELGVGQAQGAHLDRALLHLWPSYLAYATSFLTIGIVRSNHHACLELIGRADRTLMFLNLLSPLATVGLTFAIAAFYVPSATLFSR